jgi:serine/threonine-protein kinase Chk1
MLLDQYANLKIGDFGLATKFTDKANNVRILNTPCGTPPYVAPEIHDQCYIGTRVDLWSCAIILYVLMAGNTPWAEPTRMDNEFVSFLQWHIPFLTS